MKIAERTIEVLELDKHEAMALRDILKCDITIPKALRGDGEYDRHKIALDGFEFLADRFMKVRYNDLFKHEEEK